MKDQKIKRPKRSVTVRQSKEQRQALSFPIHRAVPVAFEPIEDLAHKLVQYRRHPILPDITSPVVLVDQQKQQAIVRANAIGLATTNLPPSLSPRQAAGLHLLERAELTLALLDTVGGATLDAINGAMRNYGVTDRERWIYLQWVYAEIRGQKAAYFRLVIPGHMMRTGVREDVLVTSFPIPWDEINRGYRFDLFGIILEANADISTYPLSVRWSLDLEQDRGQPVSPENGTTVLINGKMDIAAFCVRAYHPSSPVFAQVEWRPGWKRAQRSTVDPTDDRGATHDQTPAGRGVKLIDRLRGVPAIKMQGKKPNDGALWPGGQPDFLDDLWDTIERYRRATGRTYPLITGKRGDTFRKMMRGGPSERALGEWLGRAGLRAQDIESGRITRENYARLFAE